MKNLIYTFLVLSTMLQSFKKKITNKNMETQEISESSYYYNNETKEQDNYYCKVTIGMDTGITSDYIMSSSNAMKKESILTLFGVTLTQAMEEKYQLNFSFRRTHNSLNPKLEIGTYPIVTLDTNVDENNFSIIENVISERTYKDAIINNMLEDISDSYVLVSNHPNQLKINDVIDLGVTEKGTYYTTGKYRVKGNVSLCLLSVDTKEKLVVSIEFDLEQEWYLSK
ncbi:hypothetical protein ACOSP6_04960 [Tenacibaculum sp. MEBiC06402]|uniref:hypothetical protein n=1 Tax=unclassified Tenacibaculum TaxID=2635139 RepID=UPI003B9B436A